VSRAASRYSLTMRLVALFALLSFVLLAGLGVSLYSGLETQLTLRDDAALVSRVDQIRTLLQDANTVSLIYEKPGLFVNMLGNREALLVLRFAGEKPLIEINPGNSPIPDVMPLAPDAKLSLGAVHRSIDRSGVPFIAVAAAARTADPRRNLEIIAGRVMTERSRMLNSYREQIFLLASAGALLAALAAFALVRHGLRPLRSLARQTEGIGVANLAARIGGKGAPRELAALIAAFNAMLDRLATGFAQLSQVSADMAHDLRTPIGNLLGQTEVALGQPRSAEYYETLLASNFEELQRLSRMTDNMLFLARSDHSEGVIERAALDIGDEFQRMADYFEGLAEERGMRILTEGSGQVWADPMLLRRALANLLANAVRYADPETDIVLSARPARGGMELAVDNQGPTIAAHHLARLFDRFYRADASRGGSSDASGLGLSIVRTIMALHCGQARAASADGRTRFVLFFPAAKAAPGLAQ
jgi:two-component system heavy metal sensor histidine kinase CusS